MALVIIHAAAEGTLIEGTSKGDKSIPILKANGWRWSRNLGAWYVQRSRDTAPKWHVINATADALRNAGFTVDIEVDDTYRSTAEVEADKIARQEDRVDALTDKAHTLAAREDAADQRAHELADRVPFGQPILVDHYSAPKMRKHYEKVHKASRDALDAYRAAQRAAGRADAAAKTTEYRYNPNVVARRIEKLKADQRRTQRPIDGHTRTLFVHDGVKHVEAHDAATGTYRENLDRENGHLLDQIEFWSGVYDQLVDDGVAVPYSREVIVKGDHITYDGAYWHPVVRINAKSVTIPSIVGGSWTDKVPYINIRGLRDDKAHPVTIVDGARQVAVPENA
ncbi:DUF3560 domain-containing protein [Rhodococcus qingshengii]|uniref:DUF3560 domain-containing protein n=1 Tax=Rhodococcus qingshengii TaxID=334542 RepID=A0A2A5J108_RHOSG|nr:DUF3560 domain-containing protein [Rhodococcus qingshengii]PCK23278.1 hypothetical protein CHR55_30430 [Rhodococcus qingshengii]